MQVIGDAQQVSMMPATPTSRDTRIDSLDVLRGVAILGILLMNIIDFGLPDRKSVV